MQDARHENHYQHNQHYEEYNPDPQNYDRLLSEVEIQEGVGFFLSLLWGCGVVGEGRSGAREWRGRGGRSGGRERGGGVTV